MARCLPKNLVATAKVAVMGQMAATVEIAKVVAMVEKADVTGLMVAAEVAVQRAKTPLKTNQMLKL